MSRRRFQRTYKSIISKVHSELYLYLRLCSACSSDSSRSGESLASEELAFEAGDTVLPGVDGEDDGKDSEQQNKVAHNGDLLRVEEKEREKRGNLRRAGRRQQGKGQRRER